MACPSGHDLLAFHLSNLVQERCEAVRVHLEKCDFCGAELQLLETFPQEDLCCCDETADLPVPLRRLAEALIGGGETSFRSLLEFSRESEPVSSVER